MPLATLPPSLPRPQRDGYQISPQDVILRTPMQTGKARTRRQFTSAPTQFQVTWELSDLQLKIFQAWHKYTIHGGNDAFSLELLNGSGISTMEAKFVAMGNNPYTVKLKDAPASNYWMVNAMVEVYSPTMLTEEELAPYL